MRKWSEDFPQRATFWQPSCIYIILVEQNKRKPGDSENWTLSCVHVVSSSDKKKTPHIPEWKEKRRNRSYLNIPFLFLTREIPPLPLNFVRNGKMKIFMAKTYTFSLWISLYNHHRRTTIVATTFTSNWVTFCAFLIHFFLASKKKLC